METIGIDVSKEHLDVVVLDGHGTMVCEQRVKNEVKALSKLLQGMQDRQVLGNDHLVCMEATGHYGYRAIVACLDLGMRVWVAHPMDIKLSLGMQRGKNDKVDARRIAKYAQKYPEKAEVIDRNYLHFEELKKLLASREFFVRERAKCKGQLNDDVHFLSGATSQIVKKELKRQVASLSRSILALETAIDAFVKADQQLHKKCELIRTVPGVGPAVAYELLSVTKGFTRLMDPRKFACYAGSAPFEHSSGKSIRGRTRVSHRANKHTKSMLHLAAMAAIKSPGTQRDYYQRKCAEGKKPILVLNAVRNKIIHYVCAVLRSEQPFKPYLQEP